MGGKAPHSYMHILVRVLVATQLGQDICNTETRGPHATALRAVNHNNENAWLLATDRSGGPHVPSPDGPNNGPSLRGWYVVDCRRSLRYDTLHYETLPLNPSMGPTV